MSVNRPARLAVLLAATACLAPALAQATPLNADGSRDFKGDVTHVGLMHGLTSDALEVTSDPVTVDLGTLDVITATLTAPVGEAYAVDVPAGESWFLVASHQLHVRDQLWGRRDMAGVDLAARG